MESRIGRPNMDEALEPGHDFPSRESEEMLNEHVVYDEEDEEEINDGGLNNSGDNFSCSDESEWGTVNGNFNVNEILHAEGGSDNDDGTEEKALYIPEPVLTLGNAHKPEVPKLPIESVPIGCRVWIVDEEDVELLLREHWEDSYRAVCNGRMGGIVMRHSGNVTLVAFHDARLDINFSLSLPRACLSIVPIDPYDRSPQPSKRLAISCFGLGNLDPRAGRNHGETIQKIYPHFYESLSVLEVSSQPLFIHAREYLKMKDFSKALPLLNELIAKNVNCDVSIKVDLLTMRSRVYVFLERYKEALNDALEVIKMEPCWVKGYLSAARAFAGLGRFSEAAVNIRRSIFLLLHSRALRKVEELNTFLLNLQNVLSRDSLDLFLDYQYAKRLITRRQYAKSEVVYMEDFIILAMTSIFCDPSKYVGRCCTCFKLTTEKMRIPVDSINLTNVDQLAYFCSSDCQQRSSLFFSMELGHHRVAVERARDLISTNATTLKQTSLDLAWMATRLFLMVCVTHDRLSSQRRRQPQQRRSNEESSSTSIDESDQSNNSEKNWPIQLQAALIHLGVFPLVTHQMSGRVQEELRVVFNTLTAFFAEEERQMYSLGLFYAIYEYLQSFAVCVDNVTGVRSCGGKGFVQVFYLPKLLGAVRRVNSSDANCVVRLDEKTNRLCLVATKPIPANETLSIPIWSAFDPMTPL